MFDDLLRSSQFAADALLFGFKKVKGNSVGVARLHEFELLILELLDAFLLSF
ncbi:MAG: hypothetical protein ACRDYA_13400 [Egibacteraceae bacterium]